MKEQDVVEIKEGVSNDFCKGCGWCCILFYLPYRLKQYKQWLKAWEKILRKTPLSSYKEKDQKWYRDLLIITKYFHQRKDVDTKRYRMWRKKGRYPYYCDLLDKKSRTCSKYNNRPELCKRYICKQPEGNKQAADDYFKED